MAGRWICAPKHSRSSGCRAGQAGRVIRLVPVGLGRNVPAVRVGAGEKLHGRTASRMVKLAGVLFEGLLEVTNPDNLRRAIRTALSTCKLDSLTLPR